MKQIEALLFYLRLIAIWICIGKLFDVQCDRLRIEHVKEIRLKLFLLLLLLFWH